MTLTKEHFFIETIRQACSSLDITVALRRMRSYFVGIFPLEVLSVAILDIELKRIHQIAYASEDSANWMDQYHPLGDDTYEYIKNVKISHPIIINDVVSDANTQDTFTIVNQAYVQLDHTKGISVLALPLIIDDQWIGNLILTTSGKAKYIQHHADLFEPLTEPLALVVSNCLQYREIERLQGIVADENKFLRQQLSHSSDKIIGKDYGLRHVMEMVDQTAPKSNPVLLLGETGTGKEVIANAIHYASPRRNGPFVKINCGAIPESLIDSELFGHEKGSFTGASEQKRGRFERADGGTIFLDEIGELPLAAQVKILRVIQNKEFERVGGKETLTADIRIITATHRDLASMVTSSEFREDLYYRLNVFPIMIPPLRHRTMDIPELIRHFITEKSIELKMKEVPKLASGTLDTLTAYSWPGNVRELENVVERALIRYAGGALSLDDFLAPKVQSTIAYPVHQPNAPMLSFDEMAKQHIEAALAQTKGRISGPHGAAKLLGLHPNTLRSKMLKLKIQT